MTSLIARASLVVVALLTGCSITHRSDAFACVKQSDCTGGRQCVNNSCVTGVEPDAPLTIDAPVHRDANSCPSQCTTCDPQGGTCIIDCSATNVCNSDVQCPPGFSCDITCGDNSCRNGIDCTQGKACTIDCMGGSSCRNINCGPNRCSVMCGGDTSCRGVDCSASCACDVTCSGNNSCGDTGATCPMKAAALCDVGKGCSSQFPGCNTCP